MAKFKAITFDYFGTIVDVDEGGKAGMKRVLSNFGITADPLQTYLQWDINNVQIYRSGPYRLYREVAREALEITLNNIYPNWSEKENSASATEILLAGLVKEAPPHTEAVDILNSLRDQYPLLPITNMDTDLFFQTQLSDFFPKVITAEQAKAYKPSERIFLKAIEHLGIEPNKILHVSLAPWADIDGAKPLGMKVAWINRTNEKLSVWSPRPDYEFPDLNGLKELLL